MIKNRFIVIVTTYNVVDWITMNITMIKYQSFTNWKCLIVDDGSTDGTYETLLTLTQNDNNFQVIQTEDYEQGQGAAYLKAIKSFIFEKEDIIVEVDGDDWLSSCFVLAYLDQVYRQESIWMTYGQYQEYPLGNLGGHYQMYLDNAVDSTNTYREAPFPYSHLKTYKYHLLERVRERDLIDPLTRKPWNKAWDHALCLPMVEMAGKNRIYRCEDILYTLNRSDSLQNEGKNSHRLQKEVEQRIRTQKRYSRL